MTFKKFQSERYNLQISGNFDRFNQNHAFVLAHEFDPKTGELTGRAPFKPSLEQIADVLCDCEYQPAR